MKSSLYNQKDKTESEYSLGEIIKPSAESLSESFRAFGYDLKSALNFRIILFESKYRHIRVNTIPSFKLSKIHKI